MTKPSTFCSRTEHPDTLALQVERYRRCLDEQHVSEEIRPQMLDDRFRNSMTIVASKNRTECISGTNLHRSDAWFALGRATRWADGGCGRSLRWSSSKMAKHRLPPPALTSPRKPHLQLPCYFGIDHLGSYIHRIDPVFGTGGRVISLVVRSVLHGRVSNDFPVGAPSRGSLGIDTRETYSLVIILASGELIGGRAIEVIFYEWECYGSHLWQIPALWLGGIRSEQGPSFRLRLLSLH